MLYLQESWLKLKQYKALGLGNTAEVIQVAAVDFSGSVLIDALVKPTVPIELGAYRVHGISQQMVADAHPFDLVFLDLLKAVGGRELVVYNAAFDLRLIRQSLAAHNIYLHLPEKTWTNGRRIWCAMLAYSQWVGDWDDRRSSYRWQKLPGGNHSAVGDCRATLEVIRRMAGY